MEVKKISKELKIQLLKVQPSKDGLIEYRPCQVRLKNGEICNRVCLVEAKSYLQIWGMMPDEDIGKGYILIENIEKIQESPFRLPAIFANKLYRAGETGMGYFLYKLEFNNSKNIDVLSGNVVDFPPISNDFFEIKIKNVFPHKGSRVKSIQCPEYLWCLYNE